MRTAVLILGVLAAVASAALAGSWLDRYSDEQAAIEPVRPLLQMDVALSARLDGLDQRISAARALLVAAGLSVIGTALAATRRMRLAALPFLAAAVLPALYDPQAEVFAILCVFAAGLALAAGTGASQRRTMWGPE